jgi:hypothetical protein
VRVMGDVQHEVMTVRVVDAPPRRREAFDAVLGKQSDGVIHGRLGHGGYGTREPVPLPRVLRVPKFALVEEPPVPKTTQTPSTPTCTCLAAS